MQYKAYGNTGKQLSVIGFGGMRFPKTDGDYDMDACADMVRQANRLGINYFDTAPYYNDDRSEDIFGHAFREMPGEFYVSTKCSEKDGSKLRASLERSLKRLGVSRINFFHIWCILSLDDYKSRMVPGGAWETAMKAKEEGLIEHVVFSTHCNGDEISQIVNDGVFEGMTIGYNAINFPFRRKGLEAAYAKGLGVATMNPLGGGLIPQHADRFSFIRDAADASTVEAAIRFNASHDEITSVLIGMGSLDQVKAGAAMGDNLTPNSRQRMDEIAAQLGPAMDTLCTGCSYCDGCPAGIEIPKYLQAYNHKLLGNEKEVTGMLKWHWGLKADGAGTCIDCGACEAKCTQHLPIVQRLKEIADMAKA